MAGGHLRDLVMAGEDNIEVEVKETELSSFNRFCCSGEESQVLWK
jgi:hypothetical protein